jgi:hypothetical protein
MDNLTGLLLLTYQMKSDNLKLCGLKSNLLIRVVGVHIVLSIEIDENDLVC